MSIKTSKHIGMFEFEKATAVPKSTICYTLARRHGGPRNETTAWCVMGPKDIRGYQYSLQWVRGDRRGIMVRAGCRYKTLEAAFTHWNKKTKRGGYSQIFSAEGQLSLAIVTAMLAYAKMQFLPGTLKLKYDFTTTLKRRK